MDKIRLDIVGLSAAHSQGSYTLILGEETGDRKLPIVIGAFEAQAIAVEIEKIVPFRPMTHDLFVSFCKTFEIDVLEAVIHSLIEGVFHSKIVCRQNGKTYEIDARTSDAIALAVRFNCSIFTNANVLETAGIRIEDHEEADTGPARHSMHDSPGSKTEDDYKSMSIKDLEDRLEKALRVEDYVRAALIRDEINRRKK